MEKPFRTVVVEYCVTETASINQPDADRDVRATFENRLRILQESESFDLASAAAQADVAGQERGMGWLMHGKGDGESQEGRGLEPWCVVSAKLGLGSLRQGQRIRPQPARAW